MRKPWSQPSTGNANFWTGVAAMSIIIPDISGLTGTRYGPPVIRTRWCVESTCTCNGGRGVTGRCWAAAKQGISEKTRSTDTQNNQ